MCVRAHTHTHTHRDLVGNVDLAVLLLVVQIGCKFVQKCCFPLVSECGFFNLNSVRHAKKLCFYVGGSGFAHISLLLSAIQEIFLFFFKR